MKDVYRSTGLPHQFYVIQTGNRYVAKLLRFLLSVVQKLTGKKLEQLLNLDKEIVIRTTKGERK